MEVAMVYVTGIKSQQLKQLLDSWGHDIVCRLYRRFKIMKCRIYTSGIGSSLGPTRHRSSNVPAEQNNEELGCGGDASAVMWCNESSDVAVNAWGQKGKNGML